MKVKVSEASGPALDWMVAKAEGAFDLGLRSTYGAKTAWEFSFRDDEDTDRIDRFYLADYEPSTDWAQGGPIIERERLNLRASGAGDWVASTHDVPHPDRVVQYGPTPLIAAMRAYAASKLGDEVEVPDALTP